MTLANITAARRIILFTCAILISLQTLANANGQGSSISNTDDCDCSKSTGSCTASIQIVSQKETYNSVDGVDELEWKFRINSSERAKCSCVKVSVQGPPFGSSPGSSQLGIYTIYNRKIYGSIEISDTNRISPGWRVAPGPIAECYIGSQAPNESNERPAALSYENQISNAPAATRLDDQKSAVNAALSSVLRRAQSETQASREDLGDVSNLARQARSARNQSNEIAASALMDAGQDVVTTLNSAAQATSSGRLSAEQCQELLDANAGYSIFINDASGIAAAQPDVALAREATASNTKLYNERCR